MKNILVKDEINFSNKRFAIEAGNYYNRCYYLQSTFINYSISEKPINVNIRISNIRVTKII